MRHNQSQTCPSWHQINRQIYIEFINRYIIIGTWSHDIYSYHFQAHAIEGTLENILADQGTTTQDVQVIFTCIIDSVTIFWQECVLLSLIFNPTTSTDTLNKNMPFKHKLPHYFIMVVITKLPARVIHRQLMRLLESFTCLSLNKALVNYTEMFIKFKQKL